MSLCGAIAALLAVLGLYLHIEPQLPDIASLREAKYQIPLSVYSRDGKLIAQFGDKKRTPISIDETPEKLIQAVLSAEDDRFFDHPGVDYQGLLRAAFKFLRTGHKRQGGSTITMQVARNFFLSSEKTFLRKFKEIFLALKIERGLGKREILELYLNKIYLGHHAYGVAAAAQVYFGKPLQELNVSQFALLAGLPKAPSSYNPFTAPKKALGRRNFVLQRMRSLNFIGDEELQTALAQPVNVESPPSTVELNAPYVAEMVRNQMVELYGEDAYVNGYKVYATVDSRLQNAAERSLQLALHEYDERHGYRGPIAHLDRPTTEQMLEKLKTLEKIGDTYPAVVVTLGEKSAQVRLNSSSTADIPWDGLKWAHKQLPDERIGAAPRSAKDVLQIGDVVRVRKVDERTWALTQVPTVEGALVALAPESGAITALQGGFDFFHSKYNRVTQAHRQPGSGFKPIVYTAALEQGYTPASLLSDTPFVYVDPWLQTEWRPHNYSGKFLGPIRLREALIHSTNLASVRLLNDMGVDKAIEAATRFGLPKDQLPAGLSLVLGSGSATPLQMARVYAVFANGGFLVQPYFVERVETQEGARLFEASPPLACASCDASGNANNGKNAPRIISPQVHYLMNSLLQDVVRRGTARQALELKRNDIAGKTGTTNEQKDAWFNGYTPAMVAVSWLGFDASLPLGKGETGAMPLCPCGSTSCGKRCKASRNSNSRNRRTLSAPRSIQIRGYWPTRTIPTPYSNCSSKMPYPARKRPKRQAQAASPRRNAPPNRGWKHCSSPNLVRHEQSPVRTSAPTAGPGSGAAHGDREHR
ncbi:penicillin-binding protein 1A [Methylogaea oryzae]|uniref:penicillin-binding protein 1A n=1 Tax=Methylogaea oryzae TaxID=1295382 RepID=UPI0006D0C95E|nr:penicillin-binding protein 1A [Methylogaea oryzae]